jgi:hypothetical protein
MDSTFGQQPLIAKNASYRLWVYAVLTPVFNPKTKKEKWIVKFGDTRQNTYEDAHRYATTDGNTVGKLQGLVGSDIFVLAVEDVTDIAISLDPRFDPTLTDENYRKAFDNIMRSFMPGKRGMIVNEDGGRSLELHVMDDEDGTLTYDRCEYIWKTAIAEYKNGGAEIEKAVYDARPYLVESFAKTHGSKEVYKFLLAAATGAGKETSTLALLIHIHNQKNYSNDVLNVAVATIPSTTSELFNELATVAGMEVGDYGFVDYSCIKPYITEQWYNSYSNTCSESARDFIRKNATIVSSVNDIPATHDARVVPVLFGSYHDLALKTDNKLSDRYKGLNKRIGTLAIGEAHQMLGNANNQMWKNLNKAFGKKCFKLFITGTPYDFIYGNDAAEIFGVDERALFTRNDLYNDKRTNPNSHYKGYPDFNFYGIDVKDVIDQLKSDYRWEGDENGFTFNKLFTYDAEKKKFIYENTILWLFKRMFGMDAFSENGDPLSIYNAPELCEAAKKHGMIALPVGTAKASAKVYIGALKKLLIDHGVFLGEIFDAYDDDLGDRKDDITNAKGKTLTLTCNKDCTGANIPELGYFVFMRKLGDSVKFFEQATGRIGRKFEGKTNCGVFLADLEAAMNLIVTVEEKIQLERGEDFSTREIIEETLANYNCFTARNGAWKELDIPDFAKMLEELSARGLYGLNKCIHKVAAPTSFDLKTKNTTSKESKKVTINQNNNEDAKDKQTSTREQLGFDFDDKNADQHWANFKLKMVAKTRILALTYDIKTVKQAIDLVNDAIANNNKEILKIIGKGHNWFEIALAADQTDIRYTNRWIQKFNDVKSSPAFILSEFSDDIYDDDNTCKSEPEWFVDQFTDITSDGIIFDPAGGRGSYLISLIVQQNADPKKVFYNDINPAMVAIFKGINRSCNLGIPDKNITCEDYFNTTHTMTPDFILGNPPYNRGILPASFSSEIARGNASIAFIEKSISLSKAGGIIKLVLPTNFMTLPSMIKARKYILSTCDVEEIKIYNNKNKQVFDISNQNILVLTLKKGNTTTKTTLKRENFVTNEWNTIEVDLSNFDYWPMYLGPIEYEIFQKVIAKRTGELKLTKDNNFIFFPNMGDNNNVYHTKKWLVNSIRETVKCPLYIYFDDQAHAELYFKFTQTSIYNLMLNMAKSTPKNQPPVLSYIGDFDFINDNFEDFFDLTDEQIRTLDKVYSV